MRKNLFILWLVFLLLPLAVRAEETTAQPQAQPSLLERLGTDDLEVTPLRPSDDPLSHTSSGLEEYWIRLFKLYRHIDQTFPGDAIDGDLKEEIHKLLPRLSPQELYDQEEYMRFVIKNYRGIRDLIKKLKAQALIPEDPPLIVDVKELEPYNEPYIESDNEVVVIYDPKKVIPYASDKKNFKSIKASIEYAKTKSAAQLKFEELQSQLGKLDIRKIPFYNSIYDDPFSGREGVGKWIENGKIQSRIVSAQTAIGDKPSIKAAVALYPKAGFIIPDRGAKSFEIDFSQSKNLQKATIFRPMPLHFYIPESGENLAGYAGIFLVPVELVTQDKNQPLNLSATVKLTLCDLKHNCHDETVVPQLTLPNGEAELSTMYNYVEQNFNLLPKKESKKLALRKAAVYEAPKNGQVLKISFEAQKSAEKFEFFINSDDDILFNPPLISVNDDEIEVMLTPQDATINLVGKNFEVSAKLDDINTIRTNIKPQQASFFDTERPELSLGLLALAVLGGFILNFMPCVFPVLALKILAITKFGGSNAAKVRRGFLFTCLGLVTAFLILIGLLILLKSLGYALGWGMQFQSTSFLLIMSFVLIVFMLQIAGIINLGTPQWADRLLRSPNQSEDLLNFLTGLLLVLLSTPCSAPYLGTAIGFALAGSYNDIVIIMIAVGLGLSLPYICLVIKPQYAQLIPHPGKWLQALNALMFIMLLITLIWLLSILAAQTALSTVLRVGLYLMLFAVLWGLYKAVAEEIDKRSEPLEMRRQVAKFFQYGALLLSLMLVGVGFYDVSAHKLLPQNNHQNLPITAEKQAEIRQYLKDNKAVLIAVGADWCLTCKFNDFVTLNNYKTRNMVDDGRLVILRTDWTDYDPETLKFMEKYGRKGLPFYILYSPKFPNGMVLPEILNESDFASLVRDVRFREKSPNSQSKD